MNPIGDSAQELADTALKLGQARELTRWLTLLRANNVLRGSMLGDDWFVIYTEDGPADIKKSIIMGEE